jgi:hypothetical protein
MHRVVTKILVDTAPCDSRRHLDEPRVPAVRHGYLLCETCLEGVETALIDLPDWYAQCEYVPETDWHGCTPPVSSASERAFQPGHDRLDVREDILDTLSAWCSVVAAQRGVRVPTQPGVRPLTKFLAVHLQWLTARPGAVEFADDLADLATSVRRVLGSEQEPPESLGPCPWPGCTELLYQTAGDPGQHISCGAGHRWPPDQWPELSLEVPETPKQRDDPDAADDGTGQATS